MPGLERRAVGLVDARRAFMHRQIAADAVAGAVIVVEARLPQGGARQHVELAAAGALGKADGEMPIMPLSTRVKRSCISAVGLPMMTVRVMSVVPS